MVAKSFLEHHFVPVSAGLFADNRLLISLRGELSLKLLVVSLGSFVVRFKLQDLFDLLEPLCQIILVIDLVTMLTCAQALAMRASVKSGSNFKDRLKHSIAAGYFASFMH